MIKYFAYGSNMDEKQIIKRGVIFTARQRAKLNGFKLVFNKVAQSNPEMGYANIIDSPEDTVEGVLYEIDESGIARLDRYEGAPDHYRRALALVTTVDGQIVTAIVYIAQPDKISDSVKPSRKYLEKLFSAREFLSDGYYLQLVATETID